MFSHNSKIGILQEELIKLWPPKTGFFILVILLLFAGFLVSCDKAEDEGPEPTHVEFDPANFVDPRTSTNSYHPLRPGMQWIRGGTTEVGEIGRAHV